MIFEKAKQEFQIRYYLWATSEFEKEIQESFPNFRSFKSGTVWETYQFMQQLDSKEQMILAGGLLKRFHPDAVKALGENCSLEEDFIRRRLDRFRHEMGVAALNPQERRPKFMSKSKLLKVMMDRFQDAFGSQCVESDRVLVGDPRLEFQTKCSGGWKISTHFWFGRRESLIDYGHAISSEIAVKQTGSKGIYMANLVMGYLISFCSWLGICSQTQWEYLTDDEVEPACDAAIKLCGYFFEVAPKLLKGLEFEKIAEE